MGLPGNSIDVLMILLRMVLNHFRQSEIRTIPTAKHVIRSHIFNAGLFVFSVDDHILHLLVGGRVNTKRKRTNHPCDYTFVVFGAIADEV